MRIVFTRVPRGECLATLRRPDGVVIELPSYSRKHRVPHDLAHAVCERELRIAGGLFGSLASGGVFDNARVVSGRTRPDAAERSARLLRANGPELGLTEAMSGALHDVVEHGHPGRAPAAMREAWSVVAPGPCPYDDASLARAAQTLDEVGRAWERVPVGGTLELDWPDSLTRPVPRSRPRRKSARSRAER